VAALEWALTDVAHVAAALLRWDFSQEAAALVDKRSEADAVVVQQVQAVWFTLYTINRK
jgi:hypothetical protein|tara:strand:- start:183 stop:359 length:177 start_codon:yes stop_codon:yes gene_type:complete